MSFVLNALRRADAERERGTVPDLHVHQAPAPGDVPPSRVSGRGWLVGALVAAFALVVALAAVLWLRGGAPAADVVARADAPAAPAASAAIVAAPVAAAPAPAPSTAPAAAPVAAPAPQVVIRIETAPAPAPSARAAPARDKAPAPAAPAAEPPPVKWKDLSEAQRRAIPSMVFGGAMDSSVPANRMLVINGRVVREGEEAERGVVLERIRLNSAILRYKGQRIEVSY